MSHKRNKKPSKADPLREFELKLTVSRPTLKQLMELDRLTGWTLEAPRKSRLRSVYFDTTDHRLRTAGLSLRVRSKGKTFVQAVKAETQLSHGVSTPVEFEAPVDGLEPQLDRVINKKLRRQISDAVDGAALVAVFESDICRTLRRLKKKDVTLELALDEGTLRAGEDHLPIIEAELELKSGSRGDMIAAAEALFADHPFEFSTSSKAERGYALSRGRSEHNPQAIGSELPVSDERTSCRDVLIELIQTTARQINTNRTVVMETDDPKGVHQLRVGLRRLRTALRAFSPLLNDVEKNLVAQAQILARAVSELRDTDVLLTDICAPLLADNCQSMEHDNLQSALSAHRLAKRDEVRTLLDSPAWRKLQLELALWPHMLVENCLLDGAVAKWAPKALDRAWKKAAKRAKNIETLDIPSRHALRKALKALRYTVENFGQFFSDNEVRPFIKQLKNLQDIFGYLNDAATAVQVVAIARARCKPDAHCREAASYVLGWHTARAESRWNDAQDEWEQLKDLGRFWR